MPAKIGREIFVRRLLPLLAELGMARAHPDAPEPTARAALEVMAGLPAYDLVHAGDVNDVIAVLAVLAGERVAGVEVARRAELLRQRAVALGERRGGVVSALQLMVYERPVPPEERAFVLEKARSMPLLGGSVRVASWIAALAEPAVHSKRLTGWPPELSPGVLREQLEQ